MAIGSKQIYSSLIAFVVAALVVYGILFYAQPGFALDDKKKFSFEKGALYSALIAIIIAIATLFLVK